MQPIGARAYFASLLSPSAQQVSDLQDINLMKRAKKIDYKKANHESCTLYVSFLDISPELL